VPPRGAQSKGTEPDPPPRVTGLDALMPGGSCGLALPLALASLRPDIRQWLGEARLARIAESLGMTEKALVELLGAAPQPPASLGEAIFWAGQRVPLQTAGQMNWLELFWRPDRAAAHPSSRGAFAIRLALPQAGAIELRGRLEDRRLDMVMETGRMLTKSLVADMQDTFAAVLHRLNLAGDLTMRHQEEARGT
jgi:hypothetical protein